MKRRLSQAILLVVIFTQLETVQPVSASPSDGKYRAKVEWFGTVGESGSKFMAGDGTYEAGKRNPQKLVINVCVQRKERNSEGQWSNWRSKACDRKVAKGYWKKSTGVGYVRCPRQGTFQYRLKVRGWLENSIGGKFYVRTKYSTVRGVTCGSPTAP